MKVAIYERRYKPRYFELVREEVLEKNPSAIVEFVRDFNELLEKVHDGCYEEVHARDIHHSDRGALELAVLIERAIQSNTKVFTINTSYELTGLYAHWGGHQIFSRMGILKYMDRNINKKPASSTS